MPVRAKPIRAMISSDDLAKNEKFPVDEEAYFQRLCHQRFLVDRVYIFSYAVMRKFFQFDASKNF